jgi:hypothetical protein
VIKSCSKLELNESSQDIHKGFFKYKLVFQINYLKKIIALKNFGVLISRNHGF